MEEEKQWKWELEKKVSRHGVDIIFRKYDETICVCSFPNSDRECELLKKSKFSEEFLYYCKPLVNLNFYHRNLLFRSIIVEHLIGNEMPCKKYKICTCDNESQMYDLDYEYAEKKYYSILNGNII